MKYVICDLIAHWVNVSLVNRVSEMKNSFTLTYDATDWALIYAELQIQSIQHLFCDIVYDEMNVPEVTKEKWANAAIQNVFHFYSVLNAQEELFQLLKIAGIEMVILKGTAAAINYPKPEYRAMGDIDFLVPIEKFDMAYHLMLDNGYVLTHDEDNVDYHYTLEKDGITFEIHRYPAGMRNDDEYLFGLFQDGLIHTQLVQLEGYEVPILPDLQNGLVLLLHIVKHLDGGLGFRQIIDWMMFADKHLDDDVYDREFKPVLVNSNLDVLAKTVTKMCQMYLGLREDITWCSDADEKLCAVLLDYFYEQGNFGVKRSMKVNHKGASLFAKSRNPIELLKRMQENGRKNWKLAKKYSWLKPFAWAYQAYKYVKMLINGDYSFGNLKRDLYEGSYRRNIKTALKIFEV